MYAYMGTLVIGGEPDEEGAESCQYGIDGIGLSLS